MHRARYATLPLAAPVTTKLQTLPRVIAPGTLGEARVARDWKRKRRRPVTRTMLRWPARRNSTCRILHLPRMHPAVPTTIDSPPSFWEQVRRIRQAVAEELHPVLSRKVLVQLASGLPEQALSRTRTALLRAAGMHIGERSLVQGSLRITGAINACDLISIGTFTLVSGDLHLDVGAAIQIGDQVRIGHGVALLTVDHDVGPEEMRSGARKFGPIVIGNGAWIASRVIVLPGVTIGAGSIVAAGAVVSRDVPPNTLVAGVPARTLRALRHDDDQGELVDAPPSSRNFSVS